MKFLFFISIIALVGCAGGNSGSSVAATDGVSYYSSYESGSIRYSSKIWLKSNGVFEGFISYFDMNTNQESGYTYCGTYTRTGTVVSIDNPNVNTITFDENQNIVTSIESSRYPARTFSKNDQYKSFIDNRTFPGLLPCP